MATESKSSTIGHHIKCKIPRKPTSTTTTTTTTTDPNPHHIPSIIQSTRCKSTISSLLLSTFTNTQNSNIASLRTSLKPPKSFKSSTLRGFGCRAQPEVAVPTVIRSSAHWDDNNEKKNIKKKKKKKKKELQSGLRDESPVIGVPDLWCGPGFVSDPAAHCVVSARPVSGRGKIDVNRAHHNNHRERAAYNSRRRVNTEHFVSVDMDSAFEVPHFGLDVFEDYHSLRNHSEIMMFQNGLLMGRRSGGPDRYWDWRLDVDNMTYEELLELGERIGYVSTGLREEQISRCIQKTKLSVADKLPSDSLNLVEVKGKCSICQEEYEAEDEVGSLICGHDYHLNCIKQWLAQKNVCAVCKVEALSQ